MGLDLFFLACSLVHQCCILTLVDEESQLGMRAVWARCLLDLLSKMTTDFSEIFAQLMIVKVQLCIYYGFR